VRSFTSFLQPQQLHFYWVCCWDEREEGRRAEQLVVLPIFIRMLDIRRDMNILSDRKQKLSHWFPFSLSGFYINTGCSFVVLWKRLGKNRILMWKHHPDYKHSYVWRCPDNFRRSSHPNSLSNFQQRKQEDQELLRISSDFRFLLSFLLKGFKKSETKELWRRSTPAASQQVKTSDRVQLKKNYSKKNPIIPLTVSVLHNNNFPLGYQTQRKWMTQRRTTERFTFTQRESSP